MKKLYFIYFALILESILFANSALADNPKRARLFGSRNKPVMVHIETFAERLTRFQDKLTNALMLQPHQECVLHHALLAQTETLLPGEQRNSTTITEALARVLRTEQQDLLLELTDKAEFANEFEALSLRP